MKLPNLGKVKKLKPGGVKINNRFLKKNLMSFIVAAVLVAGTGTVYGTLSSHAADRGTNPVNGVNKDRYQVLVSGEGFKLSKKEEKNYKLQKKQNQVNATKALQNPHTLRTSSGSSVFRSGSSFRFRHTGHSFKTSRAPRLTSDISNEISKLEKPVAGDTFKIRVSARAYPFRSKNAIDSDHVKVIVEGGSATLYKTKSGSHYYKIELGQGKNKITIQATDKKTKKTSKLGPYTVKVGAGNSGGGSNTNPTQGTEPTPQKKQVKVTGEYVSIDDVEIEGDKTVADVLKEAGVSVEEGVITVPRERLNSEFEKKLEDILKNKYDQYLESVGEDETPQEYSEWKDENEDGVFSAIQWSCSPDLETALKDSSTITLSCTFPD